MRFPDIIIAIDGCSSTGKSSFSKLLASRYDFVYLDSGALYRAVTLFSRENNLISTEGEVDLDGLLKALRTLDVHFERTGAHIADRCVESEIRTMEVSSQVSIISAIPEVRAFVDERLHEFGRQGRVIMDGRDIGTTVFPDAQLKIYMTASEDVRAQRRFDELKAKGESPSFEEVLSNLRERDRIDSTRKASPLARAADSFELDNSEMTLGEELSWVEGLVRGKFNILD